LPLLAIFLMVRGRIRIHQGFLGADDPALRQLRTLHALAHGKLLHHPGAVGPERQLWPHPDPAVVRRGRFAAMSAWAKLAHNYLAFPFMLGLVIMFLIWIKDNIPGKLDLEWIKQGGGILYKGKHPPAKRFNAGQKGIFWIVIIGGALMSVSGWFLLFPYLPATSRRCRSGP
jgi:formate dehydrogenase subunit gamma